MPVGNSLTYKKKNRTYLRMTIQSFPIMRLSSHKMKIIEMPQQLLVSPHKKLGFRDYELLWIFLKVAWLSYE